MAVKKSKKVKTVAKAVKKKTVEDKPRKVKSKAQKSAEEWEKSYEMAYSYNTKLRQRNADLFNALNESAPERIGPNGEVLPLEKLAKKQKQDDTGMRESAEPCIDCGEDWEEPRARGRMNKRCPNCRD